MVLLALVGCGESPPSDGTPPTRTGERAGTTAVAPCVAESFPCTWGEVSPEVVRHTHRLGWMALDILERTDSLTAVVEFLRGAVDVTDVWVGPYAVQFRTEGGRPAWVSLPSDPENPRLGGIGPARPGNGSTLPREVGRAASFRAAAAQEEDDDRNGVARKDDAEGEGKKGLFLAPVAWHIGGVGDRVNELKEIPDYGEEPDGSVEYYANHEVDLPNPRGGEPEEVLNVNGEVKLEHFTVWDRYNFVFLHTHGHHKCEDSSCYTILNAGQPFLDRDGEVPASLKDVSGVELEYVFSELDPDLSDRDREACKDHLEGDDPEVEIGEQEARDQHGEFTALVLEPGSEGPLRTCFERRGLDHAMVLLSTAFFSEAYPDGIDDAVIFLAACQSLKEGDLGEALAQRGRNENVAVLGYDAISNSGWSAQIGEALIDRLGGPGLDTREVRDELKERFPEAPLQGVVMATDVQPGDLDAATVVHRASNPTHAREVVELVNPLTGEVLEDGAGIIALGAPNDGEPDRIRVGMHVRGIDDETDVDAIDVYLKVDDRESEPYELSESVDDHVMRVAEERVDLGFDLGDRETVDLEIRAELEGGGESRWSYDSLKLASWTLSVASPSTAGRYAGFQGYFVDHQGPGQLSLCSAEGPHIQIQAGAEDFDGPGRYVLGNGPGQQSGEVAVSPLNWRGVTRAQGRAALRAMKNFITGDGESVLHQPDGSPFPLPSPSTLEITRVTDEHVEGTLTGVFFRQTERGAYEEADVSLAFIVRLSDPLEDPASMLSMLMQLRDDTCAG